MKVLYRPELFCINCGRVMLAVGPHKQHRTTVQCANLDCPELRKALEVEWPTLPAKFKYLAKSTSGE